MEISKLLVDNVISQVRTKLNTIISEQPQNPNKFYAFRYDMPDQTHHKGYQLNNLYQARSIEDAIVQIDKYNNNRFLNEDIESNLKGEYWENTAQYKDHKLVNIDQFVEDLIDRLRWNQDDNGLDIIITEFNLVN